MSLDDNEPLQANILLVTDKGEEADGLALFLEHHGMTVLRVYNVTECLELTRTHTVDVVLLDVKMPGMDLRVVFAELTQIAPAPLIILVNENDWATWTACAIAAGATAVNLPGDTSVKISDHAYLLTRIRARIAIGRWQAEQAASTVR